MCHHLSAESYADGLRLDGSYFIQTALQGLFQHTPCTNRRRFDHNFQCSCKRRRRGSQGDLPSGYSTLQDRACISGDGSADTSDGKHPAHSYGDLYRILQTQSAALVACTHVSYLHDASDTVVSHYQKTAERISHICHREISVVSQITDSSPERSKKISSLDHEIGLIFKSRKNLNHFYISLCMHTIPVLISGTIEIYVIMIFAGGSATILDSMFVYLFGLFIAAVTFFVPLNIGTSEGSYVIALYFLGYPNKELGVTIGFLRRIRSLIWSGIGLLLFFTKGLWEGKKDKRPTEFQHRKLRPPA